MTRARVDKKQAKENIEIKGRNLNKRIDSRKLYAAGVVGLVLLLLCAFFLPQMMFGLRDTYLCRDIVHDEREDMDVSLLSAAYEPSLGRRLQTFAEGLSMNRNYYVSAQDLDISEGVYDTIQENLFKPDSWMTILMNIGLVSGLYGYEFTIDSWKQYVIYNDDYAGGVNFIIWYFAMSDDEGKHWEILVDAEDFTMYGLYADCSMLNAKSVGWAGGIIDYFDAFQIDLVAWWYYTSYYYQSISSEELDNYYNGINNYGMIDHNGVVTMHRLESAWEGGDAWSSPDTDTIILHLPFVGQNLDFSTRYLRDSSFTGSDSSSGGSDLQIPDLFVGIDPICRLIPEFEDLF